MEENIRFHDRLRSVQARYPEPLCTDGIGRDEMVRRVRIRIISGGYDDSRVIDDAIRRLVNELGNSVAMGIGDEV